MNQKIKYKDHQSKSLIIERNRDDFTIKIKTSKLKQFKNEVNLSKQEYHVISVRDKNIFLKQHNLNTVSKVTRNYKGFNANSNKYKVNEINQKSLESKVGANKENKQLSATNKYRINEINQKSLESKVGANKENKQLSATNKYRINEINQKSLESKVGANKENKQLSATNKYRINEINQKSLESKVGANKENKQLSATNKYRINEINQKSLESKVGVNKENKQLSATNKYRVNKEYIDLKSDSKEQNKGLNSFKQFVSPSRTNRGIASKQLTQSVINASKNYLPNVIEEDYESLEYKVKTNAKVTYHRAKNVVRFVNEVSTLTRGTSTSTTNKFSQRIKEFRKKSQLRKNFKIKQMVSQSVVENFKTVITQKGLGKLTVSIMSNPVLFIVGAVVALILIVIPICFSSFSSPMGAIMQTDDQQISEFCLYVAELDRELSQEIKDQIDSKATTPVIYDLSNLNTNSSDLLAYFSAKYIAFNLDDIKDEIKEFHKLLYTVKEEFINNELHVSVESISVNDYVTLNKDTLFSAGEYELYLLYLEYGLTIYESELAPPFDGTYYYSSRFGYRVNPTTGEPEEFHTGLDIPKPLGTPIKACISGTVTRVAYDPDGYGNYVVIKDGNRETLYGHCDSILVTVGQTVRVGDKIALTGSTGRSTGPHLHLEYKKDGVRLDPELYLPKID